MCSIMLHETQRKLQLCGRLGSSVGEHTVLQHAV